MQDPKVIYTAEEIAEKVHALAHAIGQDYAGKDLHLIVIANGAIIFAADLMRGLPGKVYLDVIKTSSYLEGGKIQEPKLMMSLKEDISGKHILLVDDILDSGCTLFKLKEEMLKKHPASIRICTLLDKPSGRKAEISADYAAFKVPDVFIAGYGLDDKNGLFRNLPYIIAT